jgi:hypothetical protein
MRFGAGSTLSITQSAAIIAEQGCVVSNERALESIDYVSRVMSVLHAVPRYGCSATMAFAPAAIALTML